MTETTDNLMEWIQWLVSERKEYLEEGRRLGRRWMVEVRDEMRFGTGDPDETGILYFYADQEEEVDDIIAEFERESLYQMGTITDLSLPPLLCDDITVEGWKQGTRTSKRKDI